MEPSDVRSMCCRLRLDLRELRKKSGGFFGSGESTGSIGVVQTLQKQQEKLSGEIATYEEEWKALIAQYPKIPKAEAELKLLLPIYENKAKDASSKLSLFNKIQKEIERLTQLKDKAVKDEAAYESKASTIQNKAQENTSTCATKKQS